MHFHILTLFPEMVLNGLGTSITGRAMANNLLSVEAVNIRDYANNKHNRVDDYPYGGGAGMLMQAEPVYGAYRAVEDSIQERTGKEGRTPVSYTHLNESITALPLQKVILHLLKKEFLLSDIQMKKMCIRDRGYAWIRRSRQVWLRHFRWH